jgi:hypothetical protein
MLGKRAALCAEADVYQEETQSKGSPERIEYVGNAFNSAVCLLYV